MEVSNTTKTDTEYRTGSASGTPVKETEVWVVEAGTVKEVPTPPCPFTIYFVVDGKVVLTQVCDEPLRRITLMRTGSRTGSRYQTRRFRHRKSPQTTRRRSLTAGDAQQKSV